MPPVVWIVVKKTDSQSSNNWKYEKTFFKKEMCEMWLNFSSNRQKRIKVHIDWEILKL